MTIPVVAFFNNKGGIGKTSLVYHLAWMYADQGISVLAADLDPQANLTAAFLEEDRLELEGRPPVGPVPEDPEPVLGEHRALARRMVGMCGGAAPLRGQR